LIQDGNWKERYHTLDMMTFKGFQQSRNDITPGGKYALLLETPGGDAHCAYYIARLFQRRTKEFYTFVPQYAKSAGTLLAAAGKEIFTSSDAELGPLDVQI